MLIDGKFVEARGGHTRQVLNPATAEVIAEVPEGDRRDAEAAVAAARRAFDSGPWPRSSVQQRAKLLREVAVLLDRDLEALAQLETLNTGKTLTESRADMAQIAAVFHYYAALIVTQTGEVNPVEAAALSLTVLEPVGVVAQITPWNYPLLQASWKIAPALAAGCTLVAKPSELTPLTTLKIAALLQEAGLPDGVANVVLGTGAEVGAALSEHPEVDMISFTGGNLTGAAISRAAAQSAKRVALELGGKNPNIIFADAPFDAAVDYALNAVFYHAGQVCSAGSRLLVEDALHDKLVAAILERAGRIKLGYGQEEATEMGPLISAEHRDKVEGYIKLAQEEGAVLRLGGKRPAGEKFARGFFLEPTVFTGVKPDMRVAQEEIFGPVLTIERFTGEAEAIKNANATRTGLAGAVWTNDVAKAYRVAQALRLGTVWLNDFHPYYPEAPWGGYKESGNGRELGRAGLREYQEEKHLYLNLKVEPTGWFGRGGEEK
jgi:betaine-aldehyde dehydrogenase